MSAATVVVIERGRSHALGERSIGAALERRYVVTSVASGKQAVKVEPPPTLFILDSTSMQTGGERIAKLVKDARPKTPLIHVHAGEKDLTSAADLILGLPLTTRRLFNSIKRLLEEHRDASRDVILNVGQLRMNVTQRRLQVRGHETQLTPKAAQLMEYFLRHPDETIDRKTLMDKIWETDYLGDTRTLDVHVRWLRRAIELEPSKPAFLLTARGVGYRLDPTGKAR